MDDNKNSSRIIKSEGREGRMGAEENKEGGNNGMSRIAGREGRRETGSNSGGIINFSFSLVSQAMKDEEGS